ncbi:unnamed protein product [Rangifer tarandus platyrhynchus]|uniref:Uncharacterized protein n=1 Tax=Rangifer tarandus platyrhynchus TaxID=3082113 RepID=A0AC60A1E4_RANTA
MGGPRGLSRTLWTRVPSWWGCPLCTAQAPPRGGHKEHPPTLRCGRGWRRGQVLGATKELGVECADLSPAQGLEAGGLWSCSDWTVRVTLEAAGPVLPKVV